MQPTGTASKNAASKNAASKHEAQDDARRRSTGPEPRPRSGQRGSPPSGGRPAAGPPGRRRWRRWGIAGLGLVALTGFLAPSAAGAPGLTPVGRLAGTSLPWGLVAGLAIPQLSQGAPRGSVTLASAPQRVSNPESASAAVISGLAANGIPNVALNAYRVAEARMSSALPGCGVQWSLLAGIGRVESNHGRFRGATLNSDGTSTPKIMGPPLDGKQFAFITDSDRGSYDGDATFDRAVGPMQFIPTTWRSYAIDADGRGAPDPFNINDAALAAAHYLCVAGGNLRTEAGQRQAVLAYNHSDSYVAEVLALARAYASGIPVADLPLVGITSGPVPPPSGYFAGPAAPGPAIGARDMTPASGPTFGARSVAPPAAGGVPGGGSGSPPPASGGGGAPGSGSSRSGGGGTPTGGTPSGTGGSPQPAPAPAPAPGPALPAPVPAPAVPAPAPAPPVAPAPPPLPVNGWLPAGVVPLPGVNCYPLGTPVLGLLPACPAA